MIEDERDINCFKKIAAELYLPIMLNEYGLDKTDLLIHLTDTISSIYKNLKYNSFKSVTIYVSVESTTILSAIPGANPTVILSYENLVPLTGENIVIEVKLNGELNYSIGFVFDVTLYRQGAIIYTFDKTTETEILFGKNSDKKLPTIPGSDSYFAIQTYKNLDLALEDYSTKIARFSECVYLKDVWAEPNRIFFKPKPEHVLRDSLTQFLKMRLRNTEVRPEQTVDKSHPVDIKVTWTLANHLALIEIKWLGKALQTTGTLKLNKNYTKIRALEGAKQLTDYLDANRVQAPVKTTMGYLVIFDARRWRCSKRTTTINRVNGLKYSNEVIVFAPDYHSLRTDFAKPFRFFMEPINMMN